LNTIISDKTILLKGSPVSKHIREKLKSQINELKTKYKIVPKLVVIIVGDDPASQVYVKSKSKAFNKMGCLSETVALPIKFPESDLIEIIEGLNNDDSVHGILVQLPLPKSLNTRKILKSVSPLKDVDGFHPLNMGYLFEGHPEFIPCTPNGIIEILDFYNIETDGCHAVIVGRSNIVGKPMFGLLSQKLRKGNATVTLCHTGTKNLSYFTKQADLLIVATGVPKYITAEMIRQNVNIIDVGINRIDDVNSLKGYKLVGDVDFDDCIGKVNSITPVPGGVGPMTITMLLNNTVRSANKSIKMD
jgi:methylenetetrahydrofolate dehydrogenase (NADP+) / methenyltetrahydrofolate cyclohydrolase